MRDLTPGQRTQLGAALMGRGDIYATVARLVTEARAEGVREGGERAAAFVWDALAPFPAARAAVQAAMTTSLGGTHA